MQAKKKNCVGCGTKFLPKHPAHNFCGYKCKDDKKKLQPVRLWLTGCPSEWTAPVIEEWLVEFGVRNVVLMPEKGFGFVTAPDRENADQIIEALNNNDTDMDWNGKVYKIRAEIAKDQKRL